MIRETSGAVFVVVTLYLLSCVVVVAVGQDAVGKVPDGTTDWSRCPKTCGSDVMRRRWGELIQLSPCAQVTCDRCHVCCEIDLVFVLDRSGSMGWPGFYTLAKSFMREVVQCLDFGIQGVRVGIVTYASAGAVNLYLNQGTSLGQVQAAIGNLPPAGGGTNLGSGLQLLKDQVFRAETGDRCKVCNVAIVLTDSDSVQGNSYQGLLNELKSPPNYNVKFFAVGFGTSAQPSPATANFLNAVASDGNRYYRYWVTASNWSNRAHLVARRACLACQQCPLPK